MYVYMYLFIYLWLCWVLVAACGLLAAVCKLLVTARMRDLVPRPGIEPGPPALGVQSLTHWTIREVPCMFSKVHNIQI